METIVGHDLTLSLDGVVRVRDYGQTLILRNKMTLDGLQRISDLQLFPHTVTHIDLISRIDWKASGIADLLPPEVREDPSDWYHSIALLKNRVLPCTIVSLRDRAAMMRTACEEAWSHKLPRNPSETWPEGMFKKVLEEMRVREETLRQTSIRPGDFVMFCTGWREFAPSDGDLTHPQWYPWHPYLMNPYLDDDAVRFLLGTADDGLGAAGIGCDIGTLDSPLRFISDEHKRRDGLAASAVPDVETLRDYWPSASLPEGARFRPVHVRTLAERKLLVEQLRIPAGLMRTLSEGGEKGYLTKRGIALLLPYACLGDTDAVLVSVLFVEEGCHNGNE